MNKIVYFDCFAGVSGDMLLGSLIDAGVPREALARALRALPLRGYRLEVRRVKRAGLAGTGVSVRAGSRSGAGLRGLDDILAILSRSALPPSVAKRAEEVFRLLAKAEARVHGAALARAHFHEVGAVDSIVDIVGSISALRLLGAQRVYSSALPWNQGTVECAHGTLPVPAPAAAEIMKGIPVRGHSLCAETVTPTGAAVLACCASGFGSMPAMRVTRIGYGAGAAQFPRFPNLLRCVVGEPLAQGGEEDVSVLETAMDDMPPAMYDHLRVMLAAAGALDVYVTPVMMKKNRPGQLLTALSPPERAGAVADIILRESTTLGVRCRSERRLTLPRASTAVMTPWGRVRVKLARRPGGRVTASPEYDDCAAIAARRRLPLAAVMAAAARAADAKPPARLKRIAGRRRGECEGTDK